VAELSLQMSAISLPVPLSIQPKIDRCIGVCFRFRHLVTKRVSHAVDCYRAVGGCVPWAILVGQDNVTIISEASAGAWASLWYPKKLPQADWPFELPPFRRVIMT